MRFSLIKLMYKKSNTTLKPTVNYFSDYFNNIFRKYFITNKTNINKLEFMFIVLESLNVLIIYIGKWTG